jgi:hypothetical protein
MRSPGRCTNHEGCWLGNGQRDIQIAITDPFVCPICGGDLVAPPLEAITQHGFQNAIAASLALMLTAGASGFGVVRLLHVNHPHGYSAAARASTLAQAGKSGPATASAPVSLAPVSGAPVSLAPVSGAPVSVAPVSVAPVSVMALAATTVPRGVVLAAAAPLDAVLPPVSVQQQPGEIVELATRILKTPPASIVIATNVSKEPLRALIVPVSLAQPIAPEEDAPRARGDWHRRYAAPIARRTEFLPAPGWPEAAAEGDDDAAATASAGQVSYMAPDTHEAPIEPEQAVSLATASPDGFIDVAAARPAAPPASTPRLTVSAHWTLPDSQVAERVDPGEAAQLDHASDAPRRLAALKAAQGATLAVPSYPVTEAEFDRAGRVDVGCIITMRGRPADCRVQRQAGGAHFASAVLDWLNSGVVRYRPHLVHGEPVAEPRDYKVRFEP